MLQNPGFIKKYRPTFTQTNSKLDTAVVSLGGNAIAVKRISIINSTPRMLCIEWSADGVDYKSYININYSEAV